MAKKDLLQGLDIFTPPAAPDKCSDVVVITHKYTYQGVVRGYAKQDDVVKYVLIESNSVFRGTNWESVHDVFEVE
jgi:hypothetical protein